MRSDQEGEARKEPETKEEAAAASCAHSSTRSLLTAVADFQAWRLSSQPPLWYKSILDFLFLQLV